MPTDQPCLPGCDASLQEDAPPLRILPLLSRQDAILPLQVPLLALLSLIALKIPLLSLKGFILQVLSFA